MNADLDTLATALSVTIDDALAVDPALLSEQPAVGIAPRLSDAEFLTLAVPQALLGYTSEARWLCYAHAELRAMSPQVLMADKGYRSAELDAALAAMGITLARPATKGRAKAARATLSPAVPPRRADQRRLASGVLDLPAHVREVASIV